MVGPTNIEVSAVRQTADFEEKKNRNKPTIPLQLAEKSSFSTSQKLTERACRS
jgi:hypothetical protein